MAVLSLAFLERPAWAHDPPVIVPARLEFEAKAAPKNCNDLDSFTSILFGFVPFTAFRDDADRRLVVRLRWSATGGKQADISLIDAQGVVLAERHRLYGARVECHKILWTIADDAAVMLGAFDPPPPKEPVVHEDSPPSQRCPLPPACPTCPPLRLPAVTTMRTPSRSFIGLGAFVGSGFVSKLGAGPHMLLGFVPSYHLPQLHVEFEGTWTSQMVEWARWHAIPLVTSLCWVRGIVRFCGSLATTFSYSNQSSNDDVLHMIFGGNFRVGTELFRKGSLSIRTDVFLRAAFVQRRFGKATAAIDETSPWAGGLAVMGLWAFD